MLSPAVGRRAAIEKLLQTLVEDRFEIRFGELVRQGVFPWARDAYAAAKLREGAAETVQLDPTSDVTLKTMLEQTMEAEVELRVCQQSLLLFDMTTDDLIDGVEILGATSIIDLSLNADQVMYF